MTQRRLRRASDVVFDKTTSPIISFLLLAGTSKPCGWAVSLVLHAAARRVLSCAPQRLSCVAEAPSSLTNSLSPRPANGREARERLRRVSHRTVVSPGGAMLSWHHDHACIILCTTAARVCVCGTPPLELRSKRSIRACASRAVTCGECGPAPQKRNATVTRDGWDGTAVLRLRTCLRHRNRSHRQCLAGHSVARHAPASR